MPSPVLLTRAVSPESPLDYGLYFQEHSPIKSQNSNYLRTGQFLDQQPFTDLMDTAMLQYMP